MDVKIRKRQIKCESLQSYLLKFRKISDQVDSRIIVLINQYILSTLRYSPCRNLYKWDKKKGYTSYGQNLKIEKKIRILI